jgi:serine/threonine protein kinase
MRHPNIVLFYGVCATEGNGRAQPSRLVGVQNADPSYFMVTELCQSSLDKIHLGIENMRTDFMLNMLQQICSGMVYMHQHNIVHRDLKLSNVLLDQSGRTVKLCDFGLARNLAETDATKMGELANTLGTPTHMAPELIEANKQTCREFPKAIDVYAFGIMMWCMLSGDKPYRNLGLTDFLLLERIVQGTRPELKPEWPQDLVGIMKLCWDGSAARRPAFEQISERLAAVQI